jgi:hypothetical protein
MIVSIPFLIALLMIVPAVYVTGARKALTHFGRPVLPALLVAFSYALSALGAWRINSVTPSHSAYRPYETNPIWMVSLYAGLLIIALLPTTLRLARSSSGPVASGSRQRVMAEIPWFVLGLVLAFSVLLVLDVMGVPFLPPSPRPVAPTGAV